MHIEHDPDSSKRRELINEIVHRWKKKNPEKMQAFADSVKQMRQEKPYENQGQTYSMSLPRPLLQQIEFVTGVEKDKRFLNNKKERECFKTTFPEFVIQYDEENRE